MSIHTTYMQRALQLARKGEGFTRSNPMVGAMLVHNRRIIGEGYHRKFGEAHAEVNAIEAVKDALLLAESTLYVTLEPCSHYGKTPPCAELIVAKKIPRVVVGTADPNPKVSGRGIQLLRQQGVEVTVGVLGEKAHELNRAFFTNQTLHRPHIILKWAQSSDGFIDIERVSLAEKLPTRISNDLTSVLAHQLRTQVQAIMVGTQTVVLDNPQLLARKWYGENPVRVVIDRENKLPPDLHVFDNSAPTIVFHDIHANRLIGKGMITYIAVDFKADPINQILHELYDRNIGSVLVEGGSKTISSFIEKNVWDEAFVEISDTPLFAGIKAPDIQGRMIGKNLFEGHVRIRLESEITRNFT